MRLHANEYEETQLAIIREAMIAAARRSAWLTLGEIRAKTNFGEASISAQLRHLRERHNGGYSVEKRVRQSRQGRAKARVEAEAGRSASAYLWEYRVSPRSHARMRERKASRGHRRRRSGSCPSA